MAFHPDKCSTLPVTRNNYQSHYPYQLHGHTLETLQSAKYLGVTLRTNVEWREHIDNIAMKASQTLGFLRRNLKIASNELRERAYLTFVRPLLEYSCSAWDPYMKGSINRIEAIQSRGARFVLNRYHRTASVTQMIQKLGWPSLQKHRQASRLTMMYKVHHNMVRVDKSKLIPLTDRARRGHNQQFKRIHTKRGKRYRQFAFFPRTIREWGELPQKIVDADSADTFRSRVTQHLRVATLDSIALGLQG